MIKFKDISNINEDMPDIDSKKDIEKILNNLKSFNKLTPGDKKYVANQVQLIIYKLLV